MDRLLLAGAALALAAMTLTRLETVPFHPDESQWIATSRYLEAFVAPPFGAALWNASYWTLTQPPLARYVIGIGRRAGGYGPGDLNPPWDFALSDAENMARGARPAPRLLWWARLAPALLGVLAGVAFAALVRPVGGPAAMLVCLVLWELNPYLHRTLGRAMGEAPLTLAVALTACATAATLRALRAPAAPRRVVRVVVASICAGLAAGAAAAAKLNGAGAAFGSALLLAIDRRTTPQPMLRVAAVIAVPLVAVAVFVGINPALYANPGWGTAKMIGARGWEMNVQRASHPEAATGGMARGLLRAIDTVVTSCLPAPGRLGWLINLPLLGVGLRHLWRRAASVPEAAALLAVGAAAAIPPLLTPLLWERYFVLSAAFATAAMAIGFAAILTAGTTRLRTRRAA